MRIWSIALPVPRIIVRLLVNLTWPLVLVGCNIQSTYDISSDLKQVFPITSADYLEQGRRRHKGHQDGGRL
jgi:hypothetical protein